MLDLFVSLSMMAKMNSSLKSYTRQSLLGYLTADMQKNSLSCFKSSEMDRRTYLDSATLTVSKICLRNPYMNINETTTI